MYYNNNSYHVGPGNNGQNGRNEWSSPPPPPPIYQNLQPSPQPPHSKSRAPRVLALLLVCLLVGFGGGFAAFTIWGSGGGKTIIYQAVEQNPAASLASGEGLSVSDIAQLSGQSVVSITTENLVADFTLGGRVVSGAGSGVILSEDGTIITNHHVIEGASNIVVTLPDGKEYPASVIGSDAASDIAVLKIHASGLVPAVLGNSSNLQVGEFCLAIGNPLGELGGTVTDGIISGTNRQVQVGDNTMNLLQMSAAVSPGNSGGGLFNARGELVGIVNAKSSDSGAEGLGFAIPMDEAMQVVEQILQNGYVSRPALGVSVRTVATQQEADMLGVQQPGLYVSYVSPSGGAAAAGIQQGDRILTFNGEEVETAEQLTQRIAEYSIGDTVELGIERNGEAMTFKILLGEKVTE